MLAWQPGNSGNMFADHIGDVTELVQPQDLGFPGSRAERRLGLRVIKNRRRVSGGETFDRT
jgi:hypothetical protein